MKLQEKKGRLHRMAQGPFQWFSVESGFGLISPDGGGRNLFTRRTSRADAGLESLYKGDKVSYEAHQGRNGMRAKNVVRVCQETPSPEEEHCYSWRDDCLERHEGKEARHEYYALLG